MMKNKIKEKIKLSLIYFLIKIKNLLNNLKKKLIKKKFLLLIFSTKKVILVFEILNLIIKYTLNKIHNFKLKILYF